MSINWVMLSQTEGFVLLPGEQRLYTSPPRTSLSLQSLNSAPNTALLPLKAATGCVYLTNQRIVYIPNAALPLFQSFQAPLLNVQDSRVTVPWLGPNAWVARIQPVPGGGIPPQHLAVELKLTFSDGGAYDFHTKFVEVRERLMQVVDVAIEHGAVQENGSGRSGGRRGDVLSSINLGAVHLEQLPAYEEARTGVPLPHTETDFNAQAPVQAAVGAEAAESRPNEPSRLNPPVEPPPAYEEVQRASMVNSVEEELRSR